MILDSDLAQADRDAAVAWEHALAAGDAALQDMASMSRSWVTQKTGDLDDILAQAREWRHWSETVGLGGPWPHQSIIKALMDRGDLLAADPEVRTGLASPGSVHFEVATRLLAAVIAARRAALDAARDHLARAYEIMPFLEERSGLEAGPPLAEVLLALDRPEEALALVERTLAPSPPTPAWWIA